MPHTFKSAPERTVDVKKSQFGPAPVFPEGLNLQPGPKQMNSKVFQGYNDLLLGQFPTTLATLLIEFNKFVASLDHDYVIFMARKALRLHDLLVLTGGQRTRVLSLSDHVLSQDQTLFANKRVALIDDTLILGTTLHSATTTLLRAGAAQVDTIVFCADKDNWRPEIISPTKIFAVLPEREILTFCNAVVRALSLAPIPYLTDFRISTNVRIPGSGFEQLASNPRWESYNLASKMQENANIDILTFLPSDTTLQQMQAIMPAGLGPMIDIVKVRLFARRTKRGYWARFLPIGTMSPMKTQEVSTAFDNACLLISSVSSNPLNILRERLNNTRGQLFFLQYYCSTIIGYTFFADFRNILPNPKFLEIDLSEATRHFGPWLRTEIDHVHRTAARIAAGYGVPEINIHQIHQASIPEEIDQISIREYTTFAGASGPDSRSSSGSVLINLMRAFILLFHEHELPARAEAKLWGSSIFSVSAADAPHRDRLRYGFAWRSLVKVILGKTGLRISHRRANLLSLLLDHLIDLGIAVPIICEQGTVVFRAYRHGEDVRFGDQEIGLAYLSIEGFIAEAGQDYISRVTTEKLLSILIRLGAAKGFLQIVHGKSGRDGIARIGFHLHGAVPMLIDQDVLYADNEDSWVSRYMLDRDVIRVRKSGGYMLGVKPNAAYVTPNAEHYARQFGRLMGLATRNSAGSGSKLLSEQEMVVLATCLTPGDTAAAIAAELRIFVRWFNRHYPTSRNWDWKNETGLRLELAKLTRRSGYVGLNSARFKLKAYSTNELDRIIERVDLHFRNLPNGSFMAEQWHDDWQLIRSYRTLEQSTKFNPMISELREMLCIAGLGILSIEFAVVSALLSLNRRNVRQFRARTSRIVDFINSVSRNADLRPRLAIVRDRFLSAIQSGKPAMDPSVVAAFGERMLRSHMAEFSSVIARVSEIYRDFERQHVRENYSYVLWYDIVDSTGEKFGKKGNLLRAYRQRVSAFKNGVANDLANLQYEADRQRARVHAWQGPIDSSDDERHVFFSRERPLEWFSNSMRLVLRRVNAHRVCVRMIGLRADFTGDAAHRLGAERTVHGDSFWEHFSRLKKGLRQFEEHEAWNATGAEPTASSVWFVGELTNALAHSDLPGNFQETRHQLATELGDLKIDHVCIGGVTRLSTLQ